MINAGADGVIIGSAIIKKIKEIENKELLLNILNKFAYEMKNSCKIDK
jgi:tryptophan synthase alpha subunit